MSYLFDGPALLVSVVELPLPVHGCRAPSRAGRVGSQTEHRVGRIEHRGERSGEPEVLSGSGVKILQHQRVRV